MSEATDFIKNKCHQLGNPMEPMIFKADALEAVQIATTETERRSLEAFRQLCPCYHGGKCKHYAHSQKRSTNVCDMECNRMRLFREKVGASLVNY